MAEIVGAIACSHGPLLCMDPTYWELRAQADRFGKAHWYRGTPYDFASLREARHGAFHQQTLPGAQKVAYAACQRELDLLAQHAEMLRPDLVVLIGNDQREVFQDDITPALAVYTGNPILNIALTDEQRARLPPGIAQAEQGHCPPNGAAYPGSPAQALAIVNSLTDQGFDVSTSARLPEGSNRQNGIPHAFGFIYRRIFRDSPPPSIPVFLNVGVSPNQIRVGRTFDLGRALALAMKGLPPEVRVLLVASGGLSHFVVDEELDRRVLRDLQVYDEVSLRSIQESWFNGNTCEIKSWLTLGAAMEALGGKMATCAYIPCYRTEAGTGSGMGFASWSMGGDHEQA